MKCVAAMIHSCPDGILNYPVFFILVRKVFSFFIANSLFIGQYNNISQQKMSSNNTETKWQIQLIFIYYTSYADRNNFRLLKQQNYRRFLIDSETVMKEASFVHYDIAFQKINHTAILFGQFLNLIPDIAEILYKKMSRAQAFKKYLRKNIKPLYEQILNKSEFGQDVRVIMNNKIDRKLKQKLEKSSTLEKVYDEYISNVAMHNKDPIKVFDCFLVFLKEFQVSPQIISKSISYVIFISNMKNKSENTFTFSDFIQCLILISEVTARKVIEVDLCSSGKITKLFERMQISAGFQRISKKILFETGVTPSLLKNLVTLQVQTDQCLEKVEEEYNLSFPSSTRHRNCNQGFSSTKYASNRKVKAKEFEQEYYENMKSKHENDDQMSKDLKQLKKKFEQMCSYGEVANSRTLKSFKIKRLYERTGLIKLINNTWLDIQIANLLRTSESGKVEFFQFLQLLSLTSTKLRVSYDELVNLILKDKQSTEEEEIQVSRKKVKLNRTEVEMQRQLLNSISKPSEKIFRHYTLDKNYMNFAQFTKVMYDFEIFPTVISKSKLYKIFTNLSEVFEDEKQGKKSFTEEKVINFEGFLFSFVDISYEICEQNLQANQKLIIMIEKMNESKGCKKLGTTGALVHDLRHRFAGYYQRSFHRPEHHVQNFDELMENLS